MRCYKSCMYHIQDKPHIFYSYLFFFVFFPLYPASTEFPENIPRFSRGILLKTITVIGKSLTLVGFETNTLFCCIAVQRTTIPANQIMETIFFLTARPRVFCQSVSKEDPKVLMVNYCLGIC